MDEKNKNNTTLNSRRNTNNQVRIDVNLEKVDEKRYLNPSHTEESFKSAHSPTAESFAESSSLPGEVKQQTTQSPRPFKTRDSRSSSLLVPPGSRVRQLSLHQNPSQNNPSVAAGSYHDTGNNLTEQEIREIELALLDGQNDAETTDKILPESVHVRSTPATSPLIFHDGDDRKRPAVFIPKKSGLAGNLLRNSSSSSVEYQSHVIKNDVNNPLFPIADDNRLSDDQDLELAMALSASMPESRGFDEDLLNREVRRLKKIIENDFVPVPEDDGIRQTISLSASYGYGNMLNSNVDNIVDAVKSQEDIEYLSDNKEKIEKIKKFKLESPSKILQIYPDKGMRDNSTQTVQVISRGRRNTPGLNRIILPSQKLNPADYLTVTAEEPDEVANYSMNRSTKNEVDSSKLPASSSTKEKDTILDQYKRKRKLAALELKKKRLSMSWLQLLWEDFNTSFRKRYKEFKNGNIAFLFWKNQLRFIESRYGTGIVTYFALYRWVFLLNIFFSIMWFFFVVMFGIIQMSANDNEEWQAFLIQGNSSQSVSVGNIVQQLFSGKDNIQKTFFFIGNYHSKIYPTPNGAPYHMDSAYYIIIFLFYVISFLAIIWRMRELFLSSREFYGNISVDRVSPFGVSVFSSWDYSIRDIEAKINRKFAISTMFKTLISTVEVNERRKHISKDEYKINLIRRILANILVLTIYVSSSLIIWILILAESNSTSFAVIPGSQFISPSAFVISFLAIILPILFQYISKFERYADPATELKINLARSFVGKIATIYVIIFQFYIRANPLGNGSSVSLEDFCWESNVGQLFYQLVWTNFLLSNIGTVLYGLYTTVFLGKARYDFGIGDNILELIYTQSIVWIGTIYSPMIIILNILIGWITFYVKSQILFICGLPPKRIYNSYQQNIYFLFFLAITLALMAVPVFYSLTAIVPSCGPFGPTQQNPPLRNAYELLSRGINNIYDTSFRNILNFLGSLSFTVPLIIILSLWVYYLIATSSKKTRTLKQLQYELSTERADKRFLLRYYKVKM